VKRIEHTVIEMLELFVYLAISISGIVCIVFVIGFLLDILHQVKLPLDPQNLAVVITGKSVSPVPIILFL